MKFRIQVDRIEERFEKKYSHGVGSSAVFTERSLGWYLVLDGHAAFYVGKERPLFTEGGVFELTLEKNNG